jgi:hypothetical protein
MTTSTCTACSTAMALGLTRCPNCGSEDIVPKAHIDQASTTLPAPVDPGQPAVAEERAEPAFDPSGATVAEVNDYLAGLAEDDAGQAEYDRVILAEKDGAGRKGIVG